MMKRFVLALALALLPSAARAQQHDHAKKEVAKPAAEHMNFARELIAAKADLKLSDDQIKKLEAFSVKMDEHHKKMGDHHAAKADAKATEDAMKTEGKMHTDLLAIFTEEQLVKVRPLMKAHMDKCEHMKGKKTEHKH
jgi:hypothetical protein